MNLAIIKNAKGPKKIYILSAIYALVIILLAYLAVLPLANQIKKVRLRIIDEKIKLLENQNKEKDINSLESQIAKYEPRIKTFDDIYVKENRELEFITSLEAAAKKNGVSQSISINPSGLNSEDEVKKNPLSLEAVGNYNDLMSYLRDLERSKYYINIRAISLTRISTPAKGQENPENQLKMLIQADSYWK